MRSGESAQQQETRQGLTLEGNGLLDRVDLLCLGLVHLNLSLLVSGDVSSWLDDRPGLERTDSDGRKEGREEEVVSGGDDDNVELLRVEVLEEGGCSPSRTEDNESWLGWVSVELFSRVNILLGD